MRLFDEENGFLLLDELVQECPNYRKITQDHRISEEELLEQANTVISLFKEIDNRFAGDDKRLVVDTICELAVLYELSADKEGR